LAISSAQPPFCFHQKAVSIVEVYEANQKPRPSSNGRGGLGLPSSCSRCRWETGKSYRCHYPNTPKVMWCLHYRKYKYFEPKSTDESTSQSGSPSCPQAQNLEKKVVSTRTNRNPLSCRSNSIIFIVSPLLRSPDCLAHTSCYYLHLCTISVS